MHFEMQFGRSARGRRRQPSARVATYWSASPAPAVAFRTALLHTSTNNFTSYSSTNYIINIEQSLSFEQS